MKEPLRERFDYDRLAEDFRAWMEARYVVPPTKWKRKRPRKSATTGCIEAAAREIGIPAASIRAFLCKSRNCLSLPTAARISLYADLDLTVYIKEPQDETSRIRPDSNTDDRLDPQPAHSEGGRVCGE